MRLSFVMVLTATAVAHGVAQRPASAAATVSPGYRADLVTRLADTLERGYALPDVGAAMARRIRAKLAAGVYDTLPTRRALAVALARDIDTLAHDQHLGIAPRVAANGGQQETGKDGGPTRVVSAPDEMDVAKVDNKVMAGNVGYLKLDVIPPPGVLAPALDRAMRAVANTRALILDLRTNRGGSGDGMLYLAGYFFTKPTVVARLYSRDPDDTTILQTPTVGGPRYLDRPVYILTSRRTFSAGEAAAYHLKYAAHATTIGEPTGGGAHRMRSVALNDEFMLLLPYTRVSNAVTNTDWEGTGVVPDIAVSAADALDTAYAVASRANRSGKLEERTLGDSSYHRPRRIWIYTPAGYDAHRARPYPLIVAFDGAEYRDTMPLPAVLDSLAASRQAPSFVAVLIDDSIGTVRIADLGNAHRMVDFLSRQLVPFVRQHWNVTRDPHRVIVTGSSAGGLGAAYVAFTRPDLFGNVWSQSGAFWRGAEASNDPPYEWLTGQVRSAPKKDIRFMLDVGADEDHPTLGGAGPNFRDANRRLRDALLAKGYVVAYAEVPGGNHGERWWRPRLPVGIVNLSAAWPEENAK